MYITRHNQRQLNGTRSRIKAYRYNYLQVKTQKIKDYRVFKLVYSFMYY